MRRKQAINSLIGLLSLSTVIAILIWGLRWIIEQFGSLESETSAAIIAGSVTIVVAIAGNAFQVYMTRQKEREEARRAAKTQLYESFMSHWFKVMGVGTQSGNDGQSGRLNAKVLSDQNQITQKMILWGSDQVVTAYQDWWLAAKQGDRENIHEMFVRFEDLLFAVRNDLGHTNKGLERSALLSLFIHDVETLDVSQYPRSRSRRENSSQASSRSST